jgi:hypothetical protein
VVVHGDGAVEAGWDAQPAAVAATELDIYGFIGVDFHDGARFAYLASLTRIAGLTN